MAAPKKRMTLPERLQFYKEQARARREGRAAAKASGRKYRPSTPPPGFHTPCRIYF
ncbi:hypothetical protein V5E97_11150 [Singulisphaera sp. Ch08]|uniref:30S ribosomal protein S14 n=1 Tax=Singulisphaera sp. Ch08 TaxID=3120278 RepID=A0AAU7CMQ3_9BACT